MNDWGMNDTAIRNGHKPTPEDEWQPATIATTAEVLAVHPDHEPEEITQHHGKVVWIREIKDNVLFRDMTEDFDSCGMIEIRNTDAHRLWPSLDADYFALPKCYIHTD